MERLFTAALVLVCFGQNFVWAKTEIKYFGVAKTLELRPPSGVSTINNIIWRHKDSLVAEWAKDDKNVTIYANFKDRATLNTNNGYLVISGMRETDAGEYSVEINDNLLEDRFMATAIQEVPEPTVWVRPDGENIVLSCFGDVKDAGPVTYKWNIGEDGKWVELGQKVSLQNNETIQRLKTFSCRMKNPVSVKESESKDNPYYKVEGTGGHVGAIVGTIIGLILTVVVVGLIVLGCWKRDLVRSKCLAWFDRGEATVSPPQPEAEQHPLNAKDGSGG